jgi:hypothetical protein
MYAHSGLMEEPPTQHLQGALFAIEAVNVRGRTPCSGGHEAFVAMPSGRDEGLVFFCTEIVVVHMSRGRTDTVRTPHRCPRGTTEGIQPRRPRAGHAARRLQ